MKKIIFKSLLALGLFFSLSSFENGKACEPGTATPLTDVSVIAYEGTAEGYLRFSVKIAGAVKERSALVISNEAGEELYTENFKGAGERRIIRIAPAEARQLVFTISSRSAFIRKSFAVNTFMIERTEVKEVK
jgi:hypothetical protein